METQKEKWIEVANRLRQLSGSLANYDAGTTNKNPSPMDALIELFMHEYELVDKFPKVVSAHYLAGEQPVEQQAPTHYDNSNGSLYKFCEEQKLNAWEFDCIKRLVRCRKKGNFKEDLEKTKFLIDLYLKEFKP